MTTTVREIRPFDSFDILENFVRDVIVQVGDEIVVDGGSLVVSEDEYRSLPVVVQLARDREAFSDFLDDARSQLSGMGIEPGDVAFAVNLYSGFLKISEFPVLAPLDQLTASSETISLTSPESRPDALRAAKSGCKIEVSFVLLRQLKKTPLRPWRKGTWLARATFHLSSESAFNGFSPRPMGPDTKSMLGIPATATRYVTVPPDIDPLAGDAPPELVELWVDADLLAVMSANESSKPSIALQRQLFVDAFAAVVIAARSQDDIETRTWPDIEGSMVDKMIRALAGKTKKETEDQARHRCEALFDLMKQNHPAFMAHVEAFADCTSSLLEMMGE